MAVLLNWSPRSAADTQKIYRSTSPFGPDNLPSVLASVSAETTEYADLSAASGVEYYYAVQSVLGVRTALSKVIKASSGASAAPDTDATLVFMDYAVGTSGTVSLDTGASAGGSVEKYLIVAAGQYGTGGQSVTLDTFNGRPVRNVYQIKDSYDAILFGFVNAETGGALDLVVTVGAGSVVARQAVCLYKVVDANEGTAAFASIVDSEAAFNLTALEGGASIGVGLANNASLASVGLSGLATTDLAPTKLDAGVDFWATVLSEIGMAAGTSSLQLDADGSTARALAAGLSLEKIAEPVDAVSITYVGSSLESDTSHDLTIDTGAVAGDKTYIIGFAGQFDVLPSLPIFGGVSCDVLHTYKPGAYDYLQFVECIVASGGVKTFSFTGGDVVYRKSIHVWEVLNHRTQDAYVTRVSGEGSFDLTPNNGGAILCMALGKGAIAGAGIVGLSSDYGPALVELDFYVSSSSDVYATGSTQTINNDVNGTNTSRAIIMALMLSPT